MSTGLRQMLVDFIDPSKKLVTNLEKVGLSTKDIDVKTLGLVEVLDRLRNAGFQAYGSLETRAAAAYQVLANNVDGINELKEAALVSGAAEEAQQARLDSLSAKWQQIKNSMSAFGAAMSEALLPVLKAGADGLLVLFDAIADVNGSCRKP
jgi:TP901 family phage tail tape measure protein